jgi:hypothetical protein
MTEDKARQAARDALLSNPSFVGFKMTNAEARKRFSEHFVVRRADIMEKWHAIATIAMSDSITSEWTYILYGKGGNDIMFMFEDPVQMVFARLLV